MSSEDLKKMRLYSKQIRIAFPQFFDNNGFINPRFQVSDLETITQLDDIKTNEYKYMRNILTFVETATQNETNKDFIDVYRTLLKEVLLFFESNPTSNKQILDYLRFLEFFIYKALAKVSTTCAFDAQMPEYIHNVAHILAVLYYKLYFLGEQMKDIREHLVQSSSYSEWEEKKRESLKTILEVTKYLNELDIRLSLDMDAVREVSEINPQKCLLFSMYNAFKDWNYDS